MLPTAIGPLAVVVGVWHNFYSWWEVGKHTNTSKKLTTESHSCAFWPHSNMHACTQTYMAAVAICAHEALDCAHVGTNTNANKNRRPNKSR